MDRTTSLPCRRRVSSSRRRVAVAVSSVLVAGLSLFSGAGAVSLRAQDVPAHIPPKEVKYDNPPIVKPASEGGSEPVPLPQLPPKLFPVNFDSKEFPGDPFQAEGKVPADVTPADNKPRPPGRWLHTMVTVKDNVLVYGGVSNSESLLNDVWVYNPTEGSWWKLETATKPVKRKPVNPTLRTSSAQGRPPFLPAPPPLILPPGVKPAAARLAKKGGTVDTDELKVVHLAPIPSEEPQQPYSQELKAYLKTGRRRRLLAASTEQRAVLERHQLVLQSARAGKSTTGVRQHAGPTANAQVFSAVALPLNDIWVYNLAERHWFQPLPTEMQPPPRWLHAACEMAGQMVVFGGVANNLMLMNDVWMYNFKTNKWKQHEPALDMPAPLPREGHSMVTVGTAGAVVFGGISYGYKPFNDVWAFSENGWESKPPKEGGSVPDPRWMHSASSMTVNGSPSMVVYGGCSENFAPMDDVWILDLASNAWKEVLPTSFRPPARWLHGASVIKVASPVGDTSLVVEGLMIHGGAANNAPMDDLWIFDPVMESWQEVPAFTDKPIAREGHTCTVVGKVATRRRRRLLMEKTEPDHPASTVSGIEEAIDGTIKRTMVDPRADRVRPSSSADQWVLLFGGSSERGLVSSLQQPQEE